MVTKVTFTKKFLKQLKVIPLNLQEKVKFWIFQLEESGLRKVSQAKGYHDEPLQGARWGQRSIRLNRSYRVIYRVTKDEIHIEVLEVNKHEY